MYAMPLPCLMQDPSLVTHHQSVFVESFSCLQREASSHPPPLSDMPINLMGNQSLPLCSSLGS